MFCAIYAMHMCMCVENVFKRRRVRQKHVRGKHLFTKTSNTKHDHCFLYKKREKIDKRKNVFGYDKYNAINKQTLHIITKFI